MAGDSKIASLKRMKILGFIFDDKPNVSAHISYSIQKFNRAIWSLSHLKRAKIDVAILLEVYKIMLRPLLEYSAQVYHHMLTNEQSCELERQQIRALKVIYDFEESTSKLVERSGLESLSTRREKLCSDFANKLVLSCLLYTSPSPRDLSTSRMPSSA